MKNVNISTKRTAVNVTIVTYVLYVINRAFGWDIKLTDADMLLIIPIVGALVGFGYRLSRALRLTALVDTDSVGGEADSGRAVAVTLTRTGGLVARGTAVADAVVPYTIDGETRYIPLRTSVGAYATDSSPREEVLDGSDEGASLEEDLSIKAAINHADDASKYAKIWARGRHVVWSREIEERLAARRLPIEWDSFRRELETAYSVFDHTDNAIFNEHYDILRTMVSDALRRAAQADGDSTERTIQQEVSR